MKNIFLPTILALTLTTIAGCDLFKSDKDEIKEYTVTYRVTGNPGGSVDVKYKDETGEDNTLTIDTPPWQYEFVANSGTPVYLYAKKRTAGIPGIAIDIFIDLNGNAWKQERCTTSYCSISVSDNLP